MARSKKNTTKKKTEKELTLEAAGKTKGLEAVGVIALMMAGALLFALASFDPTDRAGNSNLVGPIGATIARFLISGIGVMGYVFVGAAALISGAVILGRAKWPRPLAMVSTLGMTVATTVLAHLAIGNDTVFSYSAGGAVGQVAGEFLRAFIGPAGAGLTAVTVFAVCLLGAVDVSFSAAMKDTARAAKWVGLQIWGRIEIFRAASEAGRVREAEVLAGEYKRKSEVECKRSEKERALADKLEDKKRIAIMKATAKAEERALAKIAADEAKARIKEEERLRLEEEEAESARLEEEERIRQAVDYAQFQAEERARHEAELQAQAEAGVLAAEESEEEAIAEEEGPEIEVFDSPAPAGLTEDEVEDAADETDETDEYAEDGEDHDAGYAEDEDGEYAAAEESGDDDFDGPQIVERKLDGPNQAVLESDAALAIKITTQNPKKAYKLPPLKHLDYDAPEREPLDPEFFKARASRLEEKLKTYGVNGRVVKIRPGPVVTTYEYEPAAGVKVSKIAGLSDDIAMSMEARSVRIIAPIPGRGVVGIELPNRLRETVYLKEIISHDRFLNSKSLLTIAMGKDAEGDAQVADLAKMPHVLIAGTTGSGKSVSTNAMILSILYKATPDQVKFIMVDPKMLELSLYEGIPHLLLPVVTDAKKASLALQWAVEEMDRRYKTLSSFKVRSIDGFNEKLKLLRKQREADSSILPSRVDASEDIMTSGIPVEVAAIQGKRIYDPWRGEDLPDQLPYIVILIDEFADLMCVAARDVEMAVQRLAQKARAAGVHLIIATQRPSTDVVTGVIKNNLPTRMSFRVASRHDSATVINAPGAENLLGMGDMLYLSNASPVTTRIHGAYVTEDEVQRVVDFWKDQGKPTYDPEILRPRKTEEDVDEDEDMDVMYDQAVKIVTDTRKASISYIQRKLRVGYNRAARMVECMERHGIVSEPTGPKGEREVLVSKIANPNDFAA